ncbi:DUF6141 family protein [Virgibacillus soli]|uniref:DUF6141 family protein n=1 Tax=Paracerasibacillus soli TaxID=480284 RepID=A0ABU5CW21_9BACI|nr:DUF6141 family protein [Virgibacillus soli]MDY0410568.1 DUF6141 family protein [Virgibacillus soli]
MGKQDDVIFREIQYFRQVWLWILVLLLAGLMWYITIKQIIFKDPMGDNPAPDMLLIILWLAFGIFFPVFILRMCKLIIEVRTDGIYIRFSPFHTHYRSFLYKDIISYKPVVYNSLKRFGGWGIRFNAKGEVAYNISGKQGIELQLKSNTVVVGTQRLDKLLKAMKRES